jgi:2C-methyl-D-erythritol 2,4-cyclodiphosphate synthase
VAADLETTADRINVKATTCEGLGAIGRAEGLACHAVVLIAHAEGGSNGHGHGHNHGR